jgi:MFS family permease
MWNVVTISLRQQIVPAELFGRVNSAYRMIGWGLLPVGAITGGFVADAFGLRAPYLLGGIVMGIAAVAALPALVHAGRASQRNGDDDAVAA